MCCVPYSCSLHSVCLVSSVHASVFALFRVFGEFCMSVQYVPCFSLVLCMCFLCSLHAFTVFCMCVRCVPCVC